MRMMAWIIGGLFALSVLFGAINGKMPEVSTASISSCMNAVQLSITLMGGICLWSGLMRVAQAAGITELIGRALSPVTKLLFKGIDMKGRAAQAISMNMAANLLGLGNAITPIGIMAITELQKEQHAESTATRNMIMLVVLNTASFTIIPATVATLRVKYGAAMPLDVLPAIWFASIGSTLAGVIMVFLLGGIFDKLESKGR